MLGTIGQILILVAFVASLLSGYAFFRAARTAAEAAAWKPIGRRLWGVMLGAVVAASGVLMYLILTHQYQYAYIYQNSSNDLPFHYLFSTFWAGQEGSFLLWMLMTGVVGGALIWKARDYEAPVMTVMALCQAFLLSMVVGLHVGELTIGASPFALLADAFPEAPVFQQNPGFIPVDGQGLNDLLQNPWMTIHPPTLFVGFSLMAVPFAFAVAALWKKRYTQWVRPALPWTLAAVMVLGVGIAMGGYWAYVTLNFGGYWAWDPVENSSLVPWIVGIAAFHTMLVQKKSGHSHKAALLLSILAFLLVVYSTFLTRSGILGDSSVHSFVDLGLYNQLLLWIVTMSALGFGLFAYRYKELPAPEREPDPLSREFMIFCGAALLCAVAVVITVGTSAPILGQLFRNSPSGVPVEFYNKWTLPLAVGFVFLAGLGQLLWWNKMSVAHLNRVLLKPIGLAVASTMGVLLFTPFVEETVRLAAPEAAPVATMGLAGGLGAFWATYGTGLLMLLLVFAAFFALYGNGLVLWRIGRGNPKMAGGALAHVGVALMILGVIASSGFSNPLSGTPRADGEERANFVLAPGQTRLVEGYAVTYEGRTENARGRGVYALRFVDPQGRAFTLRPVAYQGAGEQWFLHPGVKTFAALDVYAAVTPRAATGIDTDGRQGGELSLARGDSTVIGGGRFGMRFLGFDPQVDPSLVPDAAQIAVAAVLRVTNTETQQTRLVRPIYLIMEDRTEQFVQTRVKDWGVTFTFAGMNVDSEQVTLLVEGADVMPEDWVVVQAYEKPFIGLLWTGIIVLTLGFAVSVGRRAKDLAFRRRRKNDAG